MLTGEWRQLLADLADNLERRVDKRSDDVLLRGRVRLTPG